MTRKRSRPYTEDDVAFVHKHYADMTAAQIGEELGISKFQVSKIVTELRKIGVEMPKKTAKRDNPVELYVKKNKIPLKKPAKTKQAGGRKKKA